MTSIVWPSASRSSSSSWYRFGVSAVHLSGFSSRIVGDVQASLPWLSTDRFFVLSRGHFLTAALIQQGQVQAAAARLLGEIDDFGLDRERGITVRFVQISANEEITDVQVCRGPEVHIAKDPAQSPEVLIFQIAAVRVLVDFDGQ